MNSVTGWFVVVSVAQLLLWSIVPWWGFASPPLDVIENLMWGREWLLGTYKHPPLQAWLSETAWLLGGMPAVYLVSQICVVATAAALFLLGRSIQDAWTGFIAALIYYLSFYGSVASPEFNANVLSAPFWAFSSYFLWQILAGRNQATEKLHWCGLAVSVALAFYSKYAVIFLVAGLCASALSTPTGRQIFRRPILYVVAAMTIMLCVPNLIWLVIHDFQPFEYAVTRAEILIGMGRIMNPLNFIVGVLTAFLVPLVLLVVSGARPVWSSGFGAGRRFVYVMAVTPLLAMVLMAVVGGHGLKSMWGAPAAVWLPLGLALHLSDVKTWPHYTFGRALGIVVFLMLPLGVAGFSRYSETTHAPQRTGWPGKELTRSALTGWATQSSRPLDIVVGPTWEAGLVAHFAPTRPTVLVDADFRKSPWVHPDDLVRKGALVVWTGTDSRYDGLGPFAVRGAIPLWHKGKATQFNWAVLSPGAE